MDKQSVNKRLSDEEAGDREEAQKELMDLMKD